MSGLQPWLVGLSWAGDLGNSMVSRVPAFLSMCPCHSPETPLGPCSPVSVPVQAPPPWEGWLHACISSGSEDPYWAASGPLGLWNPCPPFPTVISTLRTPPSPGSILRTVSSQGSCRGLLFQLLPLKQSRSPVHPHPLPGCPERAPSASDTASLFISNPFFPAWKLLTSLPGQENPHR